MAIYTAHDVEAIREQLDCRVIAQSYGIHFKRQQGPWWLTSCFNSQAHAHGDKHPSLSIGKEGFKCFGASCGISGDVFALIARFEELDARAQFSQLVEIAATRAGIELEPYKPPRPAFLPKRSRAGRAKRPHHPTISRPPKPTPQPPPRSPYRAYMNALGAQIAQLPTDHPRLALMAQLWSMVEHAPLGPWALSWLEQRGIDPEIAYAYGCRDFMASRDAILALWEQTPAEVRIAAGLSSTDAKPWVAIRALRGERWAPGVAIPQLHPGWLQAPLSWRWRLAQPLALESGRTLKAIAQYSGDPPIPVLPLGAAPLTAASLRGLAQWPARSNSPQDPDYIVALCEGEPDFLSLAQASAQLESQTYVIPLGILAMSASLPEEAMGLLLGARHILCAMDKGPLNRALNKTGGQLLIEQLRGRLLEERRRSKLVSFERAWAQVDEIIIEALRDDDDDINDLHKRGELVDWLQRQLEGKLR